MKEPMRSQPERFTACEEKDGKVNIYDDDFNWDGMLRVTGDFEPGEKLRYAQAIAAALNAAEASIPYCSAQPQEAPK